MNANNTSNISLFYLNKEQFYDIIGYNIIIESLQLFLMTPMNFFGLILNPVRFFIFKNKRFNKTQLFGYLYCIL